MGLSSVIYYICDMEKKAAITFRYGIRLLTLIIVGGIAVLFRTSLATKNGMATFIVLATMLGLLIADLIEYYAFKRSAPNYQRFGYKNLNNWLCGICRHIRKIRFAVYFLIGFLWKILLGIFVPDLSNEGANALITEDAPIATIVLFVLILAPLFETLVFQVLPVELSNKITKKYTGKSCVLFSIVVSALLFAVEHRFSIEYMCFAFFLGLYLSFFYSYTSRVYGKNWKKGYAATVLLHLIFNLFAFAAMMILNNFKGQ